MNPSLSRPPIHSGFFSAPSSRRLATNPRGRIPTLPRYVFETDDHGRIERPAPAKPDLPESTGDADLDAFLRDTPDTFDAFEAAGAADLALAELPDLTHALVPVPRPRRCTHLSVSALILAAGLGLAGPSQAIDPYGPELAEMRERLGPTVGGDSNAVAVAMVHKLQAMGTSIVSVRIIEGEHGRVIATFANANRIDTDVAALGLVLGQNQGALAGLDALYAVNTSVGDAGMPINLAAASALYAGQIAPKVFLSQAGEGL